MVVEWEKEPDLSDDEVTVKGVGSERESSKRWCRGGG